MARKSGHTQIRDAVEKKGTCHSVLLWHFLIEKQRYMPNEWIPSNHGVKLFWRCQLHAKIFFSYFHLGFFFKSLHNSRCIMLNIMKLTRGREIKWNSRMWCAWYSHTWNESISSSCSRRRKKSLIVKLTGVCATSEQKKNVFLYLSTKCESAKPFNANRKESRKSKRGQECKQAKESDEKCRFMPN